MTFTLNAETLSFKEKQTNKDMAIIEKIYKHKLRKKCGYGSAYFAQHYTQKEWEIINENGQFKNEFEKICPKGKNVLNKENMKSLYIFAKRFAKNSGKYPSL